MTVGLLLITHNAIGSALLETARCMLGSCPLQARVLSVTEATERDQAQVEARRLADEVDSGEGVLVLTDLYGSTPSNIAFALRERRGVRILTGVNLPMLVRVLNYASLNLPDIAQKALTGGRDGVQPCPGQGSDTSPEVPPA